MDTCRACGNHEDVRHRLVPARVETWTTMTSARPHESPMRRSSSKPTINPGLLAAPSPAGSVARRGRERPPRPRPGPGGGQCTTAIGQGVWCKQRRLAEPSRSPAKPPWPRDPTGFGAVAGGNGARFLVERGAVVASVSERGGSVSNPDGVSTWPTWLPGGRPARRWGRTPVEKMVYPTRHCGLTATSWFRLLGAT